MKRLILIFLVIFPVFCFAQSKKTLSHFWSIPWGISIERAEAIFTERGLDSFREGSTLLTQAVYERENAFIMLLFNGTNRLYSAHVIYPCSPDTAISKYENYRVVLFRRYGMPDTAVEFFEEPYAKGDGKEIEAIRTENAFYFSEWQFEDENLASVSILSSLDVCLTFRNPTFADRR